MHQTGIIMRVLIILVLVYFSQQLTAQEEQRPAETATDMPVLHEFHGVIYTLWHTAWPTKDTVLMASLLPDLEKHTADVAAAQLPGILRDKRPAWDAAVQQLQDILKEYRAAVEQKEPQKLFDTGERVHAQYEKLVRIIRPPLKELDDFHVVLYMLYHHHMPDHDLSAIRSSVAKLQDKMKALGNAQLPARIKNKQGEFKAARVKLASSVKSLRKVVQGDNQQKIDTAIEVAHTNYQLLEKVFE